MKSMTSSCCLLLSLFLAVRLCADDSNGVPSAVAAGAFPRFSSEKNPLVITKPNGERLTFLRTQKSTCGQYVLALVDVPPGSGPPPHVHYASDEWFFAYEGDITLMVQQDDRVFRSGQIPGANVPPVTLISFALPAGQVAFGPTGMVHAFKNQ